MHLTTFIFVFVLLRNCGIEGVRKAGRGNKILVKHLSFQAGVGIEEEETETAGPHVPACLHWSRVQVDTQLTNLNFKRHHFDAGVPGYCSESYPGDVCLVVCARGRNNVPVCQVLSFKLNEKSSAFEDKIEILLFLFRRTGAGLTSPGALSTWRVSLAR